MNKEELKTNLDRFGPYLRVEKGLSARSRDLYIRILRRFLVTAETAAPTKDEVYRQLDGLYDIPYSTTHVKNIQVAIEHYMEFLGTPVHLARPKKRRAIVAGVLSEAEVAVLIAAADNLREKAIVALLACSGLRNQELCDLRVQDVDLDKHLVRVLKGKGGSVGYCNISLECAGVLAQYIQKYPRGSGDFLFTTLREGKQYSTTALRRLIKKLAARARLEKRIHPHLLRHSLASSLLKRGATLGAVQWQLRHHHLATTLIYVHSGFGGNNQTEIAHHQPAYL